MPHLLTKLQQKLQLDYKTSITQNCQKIELYGSPTTKHFKEATFIQMGGGMGRDAQRGGKAWKGAETQNG